MNNDAIDLQLEDVEDYSAEYPPSDGGYPNDGANLAPAGMEESGAKSPKYRRAALINVVRSNKWAFGVFGLVFLVLIVAIASTGGNKNPYGNGGKSMNPSYGNNYGKNNDSDEDVVGVPPKEMRKEDVDYDVMETLKDTLRSTFERHNLDKFLLDEITPQRQALLWMAQDSKVNEMEHTEKLQRYVLASFFYSTNMIPSVHVEDPKAWKVADNWMTNAHSCDWMGIECNDDKNIIAMYIEKNRLSGKFPADLAIIASKLQTLDFADNIMHMRDGDFDVFSSLSNLRTLIMDNNYLYHNKGLPPQFAAMSNLQKLRLSFNVFEGTLDSEAPVLGSMTKLTHLELESNYFDGNIPSAIGKMEQLTYLYLRRNNLSFNLNFLKTGEFNNIFAMWLDGNYITGSIPTEIGSLTGLASFSAANATLQGTIPVEIGNLTQLRRLWLFGNELTGQIPQALNELKQLEVLELHGNDLIGNMPEGVCSSVRDSDYEFKSLTSDCTSQVTCGKSCCTECF